MGTIVKRGNSLRAIVRVKGHPIKTATFTGLSAAVRKEARAWLETTEATLERRERLASGYTLGGLIDRYRKEVELKKPWGERSASTLRRFVIDFDKVEMADCTEEFWYETIKAWDVGASTRQTYIMKIRGALANANNLWRVPVDLAALSAATARLRKAKVISKARGRKRRLSPEEIAAIKAEIRSTKLPISDITDFALTLAMRLSEICRITWADLDEKKRTVIIRDRKDPDEKIGNDQVIPLLGDSLAIIQRQPRTDARIFPFNAQSVSAAFRNAARAAQVRNCHFHDMRHEAISRLFEQGYGIEEVALISGHKSWNTLAIYTHRKPESLLDGPVSRRRAA